MNPPSADSPPPSPTGSNRFAHPLRKLAWMLPLVILVGGIALALSLARNQYNRQQQELRREALVFAAKIDAELSRRLFAAINLTEGMASLIAIDGDKVLERFDELAARLLANSDTVRHIAAAPGNIITHIYPREGNEAALGLDLRTAPAQWPAVERTMQERRTIVAGPIDLVQGGRAIVSRDPIYVRDPTAGNGLRYWGLLSSVIDFPSLMKHAVPPQSSPWRLALRGSDGLGADGAVFLGDPALFSSDSAILDIVLPSGSWQLAVAPRAGWPAFRPLGSPWFLSGGFAAFLLAGLTVVLQREQRARFEAIAERLVSQQQLQVSESRFRSTLLSIGDAVITTDRTGHVELLNPVAEALTGWNSDDARGRHLNEIFQIINEHTRQPADNPVPRVLNEGVVVGLANHTLLIAREGRETPIADAAAPIRNADGVISGVVLVFRDQTAERQAEAEVRKAEARLRLLIEHAPDAIVLLDVETGRFSHVNIAAEQLYGLPRSRLIECGPVDLSPPIQPDGQPSADKARKLIEATLKGGQPVFEWVHRDIHGRDIPCEVRLLRLETGGRTVLRGSILDISARKAAEARIRQLTRTYALLSNVNQAIVREQDPSVLLENACRIAVEKGGFRLAWIGLASDEDGLRIAAHAGADVETVNILRNFVEGPNPTCSFTRHTLEQGRRALCRSIADDERTASWRAAALERNLHAMASLPLIVEGRAIGNFNLYADSPDCFDAEEVALLDELALDISFALEVHQRECRRRKAETALQESEQRFREIAETVEEVFWISDPSRQRMLYVSPAFEKIWGRPPTPLHSSTATWTDAIHPEDRDRVARAIGALSESGGYEIEYRIIRPDDEVHWIFEKAYPARDGDGKVARIVGIARDITDRRRLGEQLRQAQKLEGIGQLAGGIAHDFNNLLTALTLQANLAREVPGLPAEADECLEEIRSVLDRATALTRQLLLFSRRQVMQFRHVDLNDIVGQLARMLGRLIGEHIELRLDQHPSPLAVRADPGMIDQILLNLSVNARDAMPEGGTLHITTALAEVSADEARGHPGAAPGPHAVLRVSDTGHGIDRKHLSHIFEPFFTTKEPGKGTGLGLATVYGIVQQHHGWISLETTPGAGTTFQIFLPLSDQPASLANTRPPSALLQQQGSETILLAEDEEKVRNLTARILRQHGYEVLAATDGREALEIWRDHADRIQMLITDIVMPGELSGKDLAVRLRTDRPGLVVIFTSGYDAEFAGRNLQLRPGENFLAKPYPPEDLLALVRRCLDK